MKVLHATASTMRRKWTKERPEVDTTFELLFKNNPLPLWVYDLETLRFLDINEVACHKYGYSREEFLALTMRDIRPPEDIPRMHASVRAHPTENFNSSIWRHRKKDGTTIYVESISHEIVYKGRRARFVCPIDITSRIRVEAGQAKLAKTLQEREAGLHHAQRMAKLAHVITRPDGSFESWSETLPELIGVDPSRMLQSTREWLDILHSADRAMFRAKALEARATGAGMDIEYRVRRGDGPWIQVRRGVEPIPGFVDANRGMRWFSTMQDVTDQKRAETNIRHLNRVHAVLSGITTLIVRVRDREELYREACRIAVETGGFEIAWVGMVDNAAGQIKPVAWQGTDERYLKLMPLGLDPDGPDGRGLAGQAVRERKPMMIEDTTRDPRIKFHAIHDTLGRRSCDELLKRIFARCGKMASDPKLAARLVGDQFAILLTDVKSEDNVARMLEQRNREILSCSYRVGDTELDIIAKFGIAVFPGDADNAESLLKNAEAALNRAKATDERYLFYTQQMSDRVAGHLTFEINLRHALETNEFVLHYQPR